MKKGLAHLPREELLNIQRNMGLISDDNQLTVKDYANKYKINQPAPDREGTQTLPIVDGRLCPEALQSIPEIRTVAAFKEAV